MNNKILYKLLMLISITGMSFQTIQHHKLTVTLTGIKNSEGELGVNLFDKEEGFPNDVSKVIKHLRGKVIKGSCTVIFENVPYGTYAISSYHDENNNKIFDETWYGMPKEGVGVSNNPKLGVFRPPNFETAKFKFDEVKNRISIKIKYL